MPELIRDGLVNLSEDEIDAVAGAQSFFGNFQGQQFKNAFLNANRNQFGQAEFENISFGNTTTTSGGAPS